VAFTGLVWGLTYALYPVGLREAGPVWLAALRFDAFAVGAFVACWVVDGGVKVPTRLRDVAAVATYALLNVTLHNLATIGGSGHVPVAIVGIMAGLTPVMTAALAPLVLPGQPVGRRLVLGLLLGFVGVATLALTHPGGLEGEFGAWTLIVFAGFLAWALGAVLIRASRSTLPSLSVGFWGALLSVAILQPLAFGLEPTPVLTLRLVGVVLFIGLVGGIGGFLGWMRLVRGWGPAQASLPSLVSPAVASLAGAVLVQQQLGLLHLVAYLLVAGGLAVAVRDLIRAPAPPVAAVASEG
jgi:drug/metabolite transporter (DMT)-like permease